MKPDGEQEQMSFRSAAQNVLRHYRAGSYTKQQIRFL
jgi:hypothetical protein